MKLEAGEVVSLLGPSGCGKTTLLKLASGIERLQKGEIKLNDKIVSSFNFHLNSDKRQIGYVFQDCALFPHLTIMENIFFSIEKNDIKKSSQKIQNLMDEIDISNLTNNYPHELSGGQQQQVALVRAMASNPKIIFRLSLLRIEKFNLKIPNIDLLNIAHHILKVILPNH